MYKNINVYQFQELIANSSSLILDVRTEYEYLEGHIANAVLIPHNELYHHIKELEFFKEQDILVYCHAGLRSVSAAQYLILQGFTSIYNLETGVIGWEKKGKELVQ